MPDNFKLIPPINGLIGHRGVAALAPENTLASFQIAAKEFIQWIEFDVRLTKDNELVIFHDDTLERTTNGKGWVHETLLKHLLKLDAGKWFHPHYKNERIPHFSEIVQNLIDLDFTMNIELKIPPNATTQHEKALVEKLIETIKSIWPNNKRLPLVSSFHWGLIEYARALLPELPIGFLSDNITQDMLETVAKVPNASFNCHYQNITPEWMALAKSLNVPVLVFTVNDPLIAKRLLDDGVFAIFTDNPSRLALGL